MRSRTIREGSVGLLILLGLGLFAGLILWLRGLTPGNRSFKVTVNFSSIAGLQQGASVRYRGVTVGNISAIRPGPNGVEVDLEISPADLVIPKDVRVEASQSGLIGETYLEITPKTPLPVGTVTALPLERDCNPQLIICNESRLQGQIGISPDELIRYSIQFAQLYSDPQFFNNLNSATKNVAVAAASVAELSREFSSLARSTRQEVGALSASARAVGQLATQANSLLVENRSTLVSTLNNLSLTSLQLRSTVNSLNPVVSRVQQGELLRNLETLSANAAQASANLRDFSNAANDPTNIVLLQQTLDSARATFQNAQKITADLDELTGDPTFRQNLRNLVNGLSGLVSSTQQLQQQTQVAQILAPLESTTQVAIQTLPKFSALPPHAARQVDSAASVAADPPVIKAGMVETDLAQTSNARP